ncbi:hypothetical protein CS8_034770 [Cupriavidus sp. 8B]
MLPSLPILHLAGTRVRIDDISLRRSPRVNALRAGSSASDIQAFIAAANTAGVRYVEAPLPDQGLDAVPFGTGRPTGTQVAISVWDLDGGRRALALRPDCLVLTLVASEAGNLALTGRPRVDTIEQLQQVAALAAASGVSIMAAVHAAFGCPLDASVDTEVAIDLADLFAAGGATGIVLCDDTAMADPLSIERACDGLRDRWQALDVAVELSNARGMALANALAAMTTGIAHFRVSLTPGDTHTSAMALLAMLHGMECETGIDMDRLHACAALLEFPIGDRSPSKPPSQTSSGIARV